MINKNIPTSIRILMTVALLTATLFINSFSYADMLSNEPKKARIEGNISQIDRNGFTVEEHFIWLDKPLKCGNRQVKLHVGDHVEVDAFRGGVRWFARHIVRINGQGKRCELLKEPKRQ